MECIGEALHVRHARAWRRKLPGGRQPCEAAQAGRASWAPPLRALQHAGLLEVDECLLLCRATSTPLTR